MIWSSTHLGDTSLTALIDQEIDRCDLQVGIASLCVRQTSCSNWYRCTGSLGSRLLSLLSSRRQTA